MKRGSGRTRLCGGGELWKKLVKLLVGFSTTGNSFHKTGGTGFAFGFDCGSKDSEISG